MIRNIVLALLVLVAVTPNPAPATQGLPIADQADAVVVGEVQSGTQVGNSVTFNLAVARSLKGTVAPGSVVTVTGSSAPAINRDLSGGYGMFFLRRTTDGHWTLLPGAGSLGFEGAYFQLSKAHSPVEIATSLAPSTVYEQIAVELAAGLEGHGSPGQYQFYALQASLMQVPDSPVVQEVFQHVRGSSDPELHFLALGKAMRTGDLSALAEVADKVELLPKLTARAFVIPAIYSQAHAGLVAVVPLGKIAKSSDIYIQRAAADALMSMHTKETLPFLADLLDSSDALNREFAIRGLSRFVENLPSITLSNVPNGQSLFPQGPAPYRTSQTDRYSLSTRSIAQAHEPEAAFVQFWKSWWASMKVELTSNKGQ